MKKLFAIIAAMVISVMTFAQPNNYEYPGHFGMPYVALDGGVTTPLTDVTNFDRLQPTVGLELGTYVTPVWGASVQGIGTYDKNGWNNFLGQSTVLANGKMNLSNFLAGYKGYPRRIEFVLVAGAGWTHEFRTPNAAPEAIGDWILTKADGDAPAEPTIDAPVNWMTYNTGAEININLGEKRAWQINVRPSVQWHHPDGGFNFDVDNAQARLTLGVTYKFGNRKIKSHNFVKNNYAVTQYDYDILMAKYEGCRSREPEKVEVTKEVIREVEVVRTIEVSPNVKTVLTFPIGSAQLSNVEKAKLGVLARSILNTEKVYIVGSADTTTGTQTRNEELAKERAEVVKNALVNEFGIAADRIITDWNFDTNDLPEASRAAIISLYTDQNSGE